jgi:hypothetical protein
MREHEVFREGIGEWVGEGPAFRGVNEEVAAIGVAETGVMEGDAPGVPPLSGVRHKFMDDEGTGGNTLVSGTCPWQRQEIFLSGDLDMKDIL